MNIQRLIERLTTKESRDNRALLDEAAETIKKLKAENVALKKYIIRNRPKRGKWIEIKNDPDYDGYHKCSVCGIECFFEAGSPADDGANYCPYCGAKMVSEA